MKYTIKDLYGTEYNFSVDEITSLNKPGNISLNYRDQLRVSPKEYDKLIKVLATVEIFIVTEGDEIICSNVLNSIQSDTKAFSREKTERLLELKNYTEAEDLAKALALLNPTELAQATKQQAQLDDVVADCDKLIFESGELYDLSLAIEDKVESGRMKARVEGMLAEMRYLASLKKSINRTLNNLRPLPERDWKKIFKEQTQ